MPRGHKWCLARTLALSVGTFLGVAGAGTAVGAASSSNHPLVGSYEVTVAWTNPVVDASFPIVLNPNHTVAYPTFPTNAGTWSKAGKEITIVEDGGAATYLGKVTGKGLSKPTKPGTMSSDSGNTGTWYAVFQPPSAAH
jgi:hypothetical protein